MLKPRTKASLRYVQRSGLGLVTTSQCDGTALGSGQASMIPADAGLVQGLSEGTDGAYTASEIQL